MPWPSTSFRSELDTTTRKEVDALAAQLRALLSIQHDSEGGHTDVTAKTVTLDALLFNTLLQAIREDTTGDGGLRIDLKSTGAAATDTARLRLYNAAGTAVVALGELSVGTGLGAPRPAIRFGQIGGLGERWAIGPHADAFDQGLAVTDTTNAQDVLVLYRLPDGNYALCRANNATAHVDLGQSSPGALRLRNIYANNALFAPYFGVEQAIYEVGRGTPLGWWVDFTPTLRTTGNPQPANYTRAGRYTLIGKTCHFWATFSFDATSTFGTSTWCVDLPVQTYNGGPAGTSIGTGMVHDVSTEFRVPGVIYGGVVAGQHVAIMFADHATNYFQSDIPMVWANGDVLRIGGTYQVS